MRITPLDARKQDFRRAVRGFDCDEVRAFLATLADEYETVLVDNKQLRERMAAQEDKLGEYRNMERTLRDALMTAERMLADTRESANKEGDLILQEARLQAKRILEECRLRTEELRRELMGLRQEKENYLARFKSLAEAQIGFVENHRTDFDDLDRRLTDLVDTVIEGMETDVDAPAAPSAAAPRARAVPSVPRPVDPVPAPAPAPAAPAGEVDQWRDYTPLASRTQAPAAPPPAPAAEDTRQAPAEPAVPQAEPTDATGPEAAPAPAAANPAPTARETNPWASGGWQNEDAPAHEDREEPRHEPAAPAGVDVAAAQERTGRDRNAAAQGGLAALGIPVPSQRNQDEAEEAVSALIEETKDKRDSLPAVSWDD